MKKLPIEQRKVSITIALSPDVLEKLEALADDLNLSRSQIASAAIAEAYKRWFDDHEDEIPDDVSEVGYNPYTGSYEEDL